MRKAGLNSVQRRINGLKTDEILPEQEARTYFGAGERRRRMNWDGLNRRKFPRVNYPCLIVLGEEGSPDSVLLTHTDNIGVGGICVTLKKELKLFANVVIELDLLDLGNHIKCNGKIAWSVRRKVDARKKPLFYDIGVEFQDLPEKERARIEIIVNKLFENSKNTSQV
jgi:Tfp pilus assembly protein PilZ